MSEPEGSQTIPGEERLASDYQTVITLLTEHARQVFPDQPDGRPNVRLAPIVSGLTFTDELGHSLIPESWPLTAHIGQSAQALERMYLGMASGSDARVWREAGLDLPTDPRERMQLLKRERMAATEMLLAGYLYSELARLPLDSDRQEVLNNIAWRVALAEAYSGNLSLGQQITDSLIEARHRERVYGDIVQTFLVSHRDPEDIESALEIAQNIMDAPVRRALALSSIGLSPAISDGLRAQLRDEVRQLYDPTQDRFNTNLKTALDVIERFLSGRQS